MKKYFKNKTVIVTGHTGFKGSWLTQWLLLLGAKVVGIGLKPHTIPSHYKFLKLKDKIVDIRADITDNNKILRIFKRYKPDYVFHLAAQSIVNKSYNAPSQTYNVNFFGTLNILEALRTLDKKCISIIITSDKCYENLETIWGYKETDRLGGSDPYSASKAATELLFRSHFKSFFVKNKNILISSVRAGNVIGGGDWSTNRIIPDLIRSWNKKTVLEIRNPSSTRPWQHVLEPLRGYLTLAVNLKKNTLLNGESFNFGPNNYEEKNVSDVVKSMSKELQGLKWKILKKSDFIETNLLKLNCEKALKLLAWKPVLNFEETIAMTAEWYNNYYNNFNSNYTEYQIKKYLKIISERE